MVYKPIIELNETSTRAVKAVTSWSLLSLFTKGTVECISNQIQIQMIIKSIKKKKKVVGFPNVPLLFHLGFRQENTTKTCCWVSFAYIFQWSHLKI